MSVPDRETDENIAFTGEMLSRFDKSHRRCDRSEPLESLLEQLWELLLVSKGLHLSAIHYGQHVYSLPWSSGKYMDGALHKPSESVPEQHDKCNKRTHIPQSSRELRREANLYCRAMNKLYFTNHLSKRFYEKCQCKLRNVGTQNIQMYYLQKGSLSRVGSSAFLVLINSDR